MESVGEGVAKWCPAVVQPCWVHYHRHMRIGEGVAKWCPAVVQPCWVHYNRHMHEGGCGQVVSGCHAVVSVTTSQHCIRANRPWRVRPHCDVQVSRLRPTHADANR